MPRRLALPLVLVVVVLAVAGAAVAVVRTMADDGPPSDPRAAVVAALAARAEDVTDSARYIVRFMIEGDGQSREVGRYEGAADYDRQYFRADGAIRPEVAEEPPKEFESFVFSQWEYKRSAGERAWDRRFIDQTELGAPIPDLGIVGRRNADFGAPAYADDRDARTEIVDALVSGVRPLGNEEQHGSTVWRYVVSLDGRAAGRLPEPLQTEVKAWGEDEGPGSLDLWLDSRGRLRKLSILYDWQDGAGFRVENEFWDHGQPGRLELPADLDDPTALGGEGVSSFTLDPGATLDHTTPSMSLSVLKGDEAGAQVTLNVAGRTAPRWRVAAQRHPSVTARRRSSRTRGVPLRRPPDSRPARTLHVRCDRAGRRRGLRPQPASVRRPHPERGRHVRATLLRPAAPPVPPHLRPRRRWPSRHPHRRTSLPRPDVSRRSRVRGPVQ